jgi:hypothetical protein
MSELSLLQILNNKSYKNILSKETLYVIFIIVGSLIDYSSAQSTQELIHRVIHIQNCFYYRISSRSVL